MFYAFVRLRLSIFYNRLTTFRRTNFTFISIAKDVALVATPFDEKYDLINKFRGVVIDSVKYNNPVDFMESGLMRKGKWDCWHLDVPFSISNDEAVPAYINDCWIGANHGHHCAIEIFAPEHGKTLQDVGSVWKDEQGVLFTLLRIENRDCLLFVSDVLGSAEDYRFTLFIKGGLKYVKNGKNRKRITLSSQRVTDLTPAIRYVRKDVFAYSNGRMERVQGTANCDYAEIQEEYEIINPATVAESLRNGRPRGGYDRLRNLADFGEPMLSCKLTYRILNDGTILVIFDYERLANVRFQRFMGVMYQEKIDVYSGGIYRYLPKTLPFLTSEGTFDFSKRVPITEKLYPKGGELTRNYWTDSQSPCDRVVDYFCDEEGRDKLAFACGYLPVFDGVAKKRKENKSAVTLKFTRKHYPTFLEGDLSHIRGVAYKKYFIPQKNRACAYSVYFEGKTYIYVDVFGEKTLEFSACGKIRLLEKSDQISYEISNRIVKIKGNNGFAVFVCE